MRVVFVIILFMNFNSFSQVVFTAVDSDNNDVRACYYDEEKDEVIILSSNNSYLPNWLGNYIIYNFGNHIWRTNTTTFEEEILIEGLNAVVSPSQKYFAVRVKDGVAIADSSGKLIKKIEVDAWNKVNVTFSYNDVYFTYYDKLKETCNLFDWKNETIKKLGSNIYHPQWNKKGNKILINIGKLEENFRVGIIDTNYVDGDKINYITNYNQNAIIPIWSPNENYIAYFLLDDENKNDLTDLHSGSIFIYKVFDGSRILVDTEAGYTEGAYPQFCFDNDEKYFYYNRVNEFGKGEIFRYNLSDGSKKKLTKNEKIDYRIPKCKK